jgi:hypothetical protein
MAADGYSINLTATLLDGTTTAVASPWSASTGDVAESFALQPILLAAGAEDVAIILGGLTDPLWIGVGGGEGVSLKLGQVTADPIQANPFAFVADVEDGLGVSIVYLSNSSEDDQSVALLAAE